MDIHDNSYEFIIKNVNYIFGKKTNNPSFHSISAEAAVKIQSVFRGHKSRAKMKQDETTTSTSASATQNATNEQDPTKEELEAEFDPNDKGNLLTI